MSEEIFGVGRRRPCRPRFSNSLFPSWDSWFLFEFAHLAGRPRTRPRTPVMTIRTGTKDSKIQDGEDVDVLRSLDLGHEFQRHWLSNPFSLVHQSDKSMNEDLIFVWPLLTTYRYRTFRRFFVFSTSGVFLVIPADPKFQIRKFYFCWLVLILEIGLILNPI